MGDDRVTSDQLRSRIDRGVGSDKVSHPDPAAAPLGADDEAAGTPNTQRQIRTAIAQETRLGRGEAAAAQPTPRTGARVAIVVIVGLVALALLAVAL